MLIVLFFISVFSSLTWLVYSILYTVGQLEGNDLNALPPEKVILYCALVVLPVWVIWQIFGLVVSFIRAKSADLRLTQLFNQMKKNQDYTDLVVRVMLDAEHEIKDGFVINKFDIFIADMNEILADITQRCNVASTLQLEQLWARVKNGERWTIGKVLIEAAKSHDDFSAYVAEKARKDSVFKGTLCEFCSRYQNLHALLEKHDRDRVFITIIETGVMGKVYAILAPAVEALAFNDSENNSDQIDEDHEYEVSPRILNMEAPDSGEERLSLFQRLNPFKRKKAHAVVEPALSQDDDEEFFAALQKSMNSPAQTRKNYQSEEEMDFPRFSDQAEPRLTETANYDQKEDMFMSDDDLPRLENDFESTLNQPEDNLVAKEELSVISGDFPISLGDNETVVIEGLSDLTRPKNEREERDSSSQFNNYADTPSRSTDNDLLKTSAKAEHTSDNIEKNRAGIKVDENFAYPFGGWINEENYKK